MIGRAWIAVVAGVSPLMSIAQSSKPPAAIGALAGRVVSDRGAAVSGARVFALDRGSDETRWVECIADGDGRFRLAPLSATPSLDIWAESADLSRQRWEGVPVFANHDHNIGELTLLPGTRLRGTAVDGDGKPVSAARLVVEGRYHKLAHTVTALGPDWLVAVAADGSFATPPLPIGSFTLRCSAAGMAQVEVHHTVGLPIVDQVELSPIRMLPEVPVGGSVTDPTGKPVAGAEAVVDGGWDRYQRSDAVGRFLVRGHGAAAKRLVVSAAGFRATQVRCPRRGATCAWSCSPRSRSGAKCSTPPPVRASRSTASCCAPSIGTRTASRTGVEAPTGISPRPVGFGCGTRTQRNTTSASRRRVSRTVNSTWSRSRRCETSTASC